jgi:hypothetical protein
MLPRRVRQNGIERLRIRSIPHNKYIFWTNAPPADCHVSVARVGHHNNVTVPIAQFLQAEQDFVERALPCILRDVKFWVRVVMVKNVFDSEYFEGQGDQKNVVRRVASLNNVEAMPQIDPQCVQEFQSECAGIFGQIA